MKTVDIEYCGDCPYRFYKGNDLCCEKTEDDRVTYENNPIPEWCPLPDTRSVTVKDLVWYSDALEVLSPLRYHLNETIAQIESHNRAATRLGYMRVPKRRMEEAKTALDRAENFLTNKQKHQ